MSSACLAFRCQILSLDILLHIRHEPGVIDQMKELGEKVYRSLSITHIRTEHMAFPRG